jgi:predicted permease
MGVARARLARQKLLETFLLALAGSILGVGLGWTAVRIFEVFAPRTIPLLDRVDLSFPVILLATGAGILLALVFGLIPALRLSRQSLAGVLGSDASGKRGTGRTRLMRAMVVGELVIAMVLLTGAGIMARTLMAMARSNPGYDPENAVSFSLMTYGDHYDSMESWIAILGDVRARFQALAEVEVFARSSQLPLSGGGGNTIFGWNRESYDRSSHRAHLVWATHDYFRAMGTRILTGRPFTEAESTDSTGSVVVGEDLARLAWPDQDPLGKQVYFGGTPFIGRVVGVAETLSMRERGQTHYPTIYAPEGAAGPGVARSVILRGAFESDGVVPKIRRTLSSVGPGLTAAEIETLSERVAMYRAPTRFVVLALSSFALVALVVAAVGLFGVISYAVQSRNSELGIRMALGAERRDIVAMVLRQGAVLSGIGIAVGIVLALLLSRFMESLVFGVSATDPLSLSVTALALGAISILACCAPARRACRIDPIRTLRPE